MDKTITDTNPFSEQEAKQLMEALVRLQEDEMEREIKREMKNWRTIEGKVTFAECLERLTKNDLCNICTRLEIRGVRALKKQELIQVLCQTFPEVMIKAAEFILDEERVKWLKKIIKKGGCWQAEKVPSELIGYFRGLGLLFTGISEGKMVVLMPPEVIETFQQMEKECGQPRLRRNTQWVYITQGLLYYYGRLSAEEMKNKVEAVTGTVLDEYCYSRVIREAAISYRQIACTKTGYCESRVEEETKLVAEQTLRSDLRYYPFTKAQLLKAGQPGYIEKNPQMEEFLELMREIYQMNQEEVDGLADDCLDFFNNHESPYEIVDYLQEYYELEDKELIELVQYHLLQLYNNTRLWGLKGYTPRELQGQRKEPSLPLAKEPAGEAQVFDFRTGKQVGRNDPCPCQSGKKFKKCCGK